MKAKNNSTLIAKKELYLLQGETCNKYSQSTSTKSTSLSRKLCIMFTTLCIFGLLSLAPVFADENTPISMDFKGADIRDVLRTLSQLANVNLLTNKSVQGEITLSLKNVPFSDAIKLITMTNGLEYRWIGNTLIVARPDEMALNFPEKSVKTFQIQYAELSQIKEVLTNILTGSKVTADERTHSVVISGDKNQLIQAESLIASLDKPIPQVFLDVQVEEISTTGLDQTGVLQGNYAKLKFITDAKGLITDVGVELPSIVQALKKDGLAKTLANPGLVTLDGKTARLLIGDKIPVESEEVTNGVTKTAIKYIEAGIKLEFLPRIASDGYITLDVKPQVSSLGEEVAKGYPLIKTREAETVVRIKDGETFVIGGLIRDEDRTNIEKVPILGDIPILRALFRHWDKSKQSTEIVIFITPHIIKAGENQAEKFARPLEQKN